MYLMNFSLGVGYFAVNGFLSLEYVLLLNVPD